MLCHSLCTIIVHINLTFCLIYLIFVFAGPVCPNLATSRPRIPWIFPRPEEEDELAEDLDARPLTTAQDPTTEDTSLDTTTQTAPVANVTTAPPLTVTSVEGGELIKQVKVRFCFNWLIS